VYPEGIEILLVIAIGKEILSALHVEPDCNSAYARDLPQFTSRMLVE
jgi:hypothetical protein